MSQVWTSDLATEWLTPFYTKSEKKNKKIKKINQFAKSGYLETKI